MICKMCGKEMGEVYFSRLYCSDVCKHKAWKERNPESVKEAKRAFIERNKKHAPKTIDVIKEVDNENLTIQQFCHIFMCGDSYITKCIGQGMPYHLVDGKKRFNLEKCQSWHRGEVVV